MDEEGTRWGPFKTISDCEEWCMVIGHQAPALGVPYFENNP